MKHIAPALMKYPLGSMGITTDGQLVHTNGTMGGEGIVVDSQFFPQKRGCVTLPAFTWPSRQSETKRMVRPQFFPFSWNITGPCLSAGIHSTWYQSGSLRCFPEGGAYYVTLLEFYTLGIDAQEWGAFWLAEPSEGWVTEYLADTPLAPKIIQRTVPTSASFTETSTTTQYAGTGTTLCPHETLTANGYDDPLSFDFAIYFADQTTEDFEYVCWRAGQTLHLVQDDIVHATWTFPLMTVRGSIWDCRYTSPSTRGEKVAAIPSGEANAVLLTQENLPDRHGELRITLTYRGERITS